MIDAISSPVSTGTVDLETTMRGPSSARPISRATARTALRSAWPSERIGVPTAMKISSLCRTAASTAVVNERRCARTLRAIISPSPGSKMGVSPASSRTTFAASLSAQITVLPSSARHVPVTSPTYPAPTTAIRLISRRTSAAGGGGPPAAPAQGRCASKQRERVTDGDCLQQIGRAAVADHDGRDLAQDDEHERSDEAEPSAGDVVRRDHVRGGEGGDRHDIGREKRRAGEECATGDRRDHPAGHEHVQRYGAETDRDGERERLDEQPSRSLAVAICLCAVALY